MWVFERRGGVWILLALSAVPRLLANISSRHNHLKHDARRRDRYSTSGPLTPAINAFQASGRQRQADAYAAEAAWRRAHGRKMVEKYDGGHVARSISGRSTITNNHPES